MTWDFGGVAFEPSSIQTDYRGHTITTIVDEAKRNRLASYAKQAGNVSVYTLESGAFESIDTSDSGITSTLKPNSLYVASGETYTVESGTTEEYDAVTVDGTLVVDGTLIIDDEPPYSNAQYRVANYSETPLGQGLARYEITLGLTRNESREPTKTVSESRGSGNWLFEFSNDTIEVDGGRITYESYNTAGKVEVQITSTQDIARAILENPAYQDGVVEWNVPGGDNLAEDTTTDSRQTVRITTPTKYQVRETVTPGEYVVSGWQVSKDGPTRYECSLTLIDKRILYVASGESYTIESGTTERYCKTVVDGTLTVNGTLIIEGC